MSSRDLLFEIGTEEIPAGFMSRIIPELKEMAEADLAELRLAFGDVRVMGTPRRIVQVLAGNGDEADVGRGVCRHVALDELERRETKVAQNLRGLLVFVFRACGGIAPRAPALPLSLRLWCGLDGKELLPL